jgi:hypothetical protein
MARLVVNISYQKDTCNNEIGLCAQNIDTVVGSKVSTIGRACVIIQRVRETLH